VVRVKAALASRPRVPSSCRVSLVQIKPPHPHEFAVRPHLWQTSPLRSPTDSSYPLPHSVAFRFLPDLWHHPNLGNVLQHLFPGCDRISRKQGAKVAQLMFVEILRAYVGMAGSLEAGWLRRWSDYWNRWTALNRLRQKP
jgi:hypothetical protein